MANPLSSLFSLSASSQNYNAVSHTGGVEREVFRFQVQEQAWAFAPNDESRKTLLQTFLPAKQDINLIDTLSHQMETDAWHLVVGESGSGKTALAWHCMESLTWRSDDALILLFDVADISTDTPPLSFVYHWARAIASALTLYLLDPRHAEAPLSVADIQLIQQAGGAAVERLLQRLPMNKDIKGLVWDTLRRPVWEDTFTYSNTLLHLFPLSSDPLFMMTEPIDEAPGRFLNALPDLLITLGIQKVYLFVDNVTDTMIEQTTIKWYLHQLIYISSLGAVPIIKTFFSTPQIAEILESARPLGEEPPSVQRHTITWDRERLQEMLDKRVMTTPTPTPLDLTPLDSNAWRTPRTLLTCINTILQHVADNDMTTSEDGTLLSDPCRDVTVPLSPVKPRGRFSPDSIYSHEGM